MAIVHDWLVTYAGAERVLEQMLAVYPASDLFSVIDFLPAGERGFIQNKTVQTSFIQRLPFARKKYRKYLPLMPLAIEQHDLSSYDVVISSSHAVAKGVITGPDQLHVCMCYSPIRYAWDLQHQYLKESGFEKGIKGLIVRWLLHKIRIWDCRTANGVDYFIAISAFISRRIRKAYGRDSVVIYPPVDVSGFSMRKEKEGFYLTASRMVPYKRIDLIVEAFTNMPHRKLVVIGDGPDFEKIRQKAGKNIELLGHQPFSVLKDYMQRARAFVFAAEEDFGIAPLEAQACGTPVIAYGKGGALETIRGFDLEKPTGVFFDSQDLSSLTEAVEFFEKEERGFFPEVCRENAERFSSERFRIEFMDFIDEKWTEFQKTLQSQRRKG
jgi:glycosyltransferase involved in cell wall biosynthesis